jgi:hypothetical protein
MSPVTGQYKVRERSMGTLVSDRRPKLPPSMHLRTVQQCGEIMFGFQILQRDIPAIIVGPDTLLQGDDARGP